MYGYSSLMFAMCCFGSGLFDELITRSEQHCGLCVCLIVCDTETLTVRLHRLGLNSLPGGEDKSDNTGAIRL